MSLYIYSLRLSYRNYIYIYTSETYQKQLKLNKIRRLFYFKKHAFKNYKSQNAKKLGNI